MSKPVTLSARVRAGARAARKRVRRALVPLLFISSVLYALDANPEGLRAFGAYNQIVFELAIGIFVSMTTYVLVVVIPERSKRQRVKQNLELRFGYFKEECINIFLSAAQIFPEYEDQKKLLKFGEFKRYFKVKVGDHSDRWDGVLNGLDSRHLTLLGREMTILAEEVKFTLASIDVENDEIFQFLKRLNITLVNLRTIDDDYDEMKLLSQFFWEIFTGYTFSSGYPERDQLEYMIQSI